MSTNQPNPISPLELPMTEPVRKCTIVVPAFGDGQIPEYDVQSYLCFHGDIDLLWPDADGEYLLMECGAVSEQCEFDGHVHQMGEAVVNDEVALCLQATIAAGQMVLPDWIEIARVRRLMDIPDDIKVEFDDRYYRLER